MRTRCFCFEVGGDGSAVHKCSIRPNMSCGAGVRGIIPSLSPSLALRLRTWALVVLIGRHGGGERVALPEVHCDPHRSVGSPLGCGLIGKNRPLQPWLEQHAEVLNLGDMRPIQCPAAEKDAVLRLVQAHMGTLEDEVAHQSAGRAQRLCI